MVRLDAALPSATMDTLQNSCCLPSPFQPSERLVDFMLTGNIQEMGILGNGVQPNQVGAMPSHLF